MIRGVGLVRLGMGCFVVLPYPGCLSTEILERRLFLLRIRYCRPLKGFDAVLVR